MASYLDTVVIDAHDAPALARFWAAVLDWEIVAEEPDEVVIAKDANTYPQILFEPVRDEKVVKNRLHIDLAPDDRDAEVERIIGLGATHVDIGQGEQTWIVLADPEGNEFCVLSSRDAGMR